MVYSGHVTEADFAGIWAEVAASPDHRASFDDLCVLSPDADYSGVAFDASMAQARKYVEVNNKLGRPKRTAFVCADGMQLAMARMFGAFVHANGLGNARVEGFRELRPALEFIAQRDNQTPLDRAVIRHVIQELGQSWCLREEAA